MKQQGPQIIPKAERVLVEVTKSASRFPRVYRYTLGADLREEAIQVVLLAQEGLRLSRPEKQFQQKATVDQLSESIDRLKVRWQTAYTLQCFSFNRSEEIGRLLADVGMQCGGWQKAIEKRLQGPESGDLRITGASPDTEYRRRLPVEVAR